MAIALAWSTGKDAAWSLHLLREQRREVAALITTVTRDFDRVAIHGVRRSVLRHQAALVGLPLFEVELPYPCTNEFYEFAFAGTLRQVAEQTGITGVAFGDLFLSDVRAYREQLLEPLGLVPEFPLWGSRTDLLIRNMLRAGVVAHVASLDPTKVPSRFAGWAIDRTFLEALPPDVDPCGERGEFHTIVSDGPMFQSPLRLIPGEVVEREGIVYADFTLNAPVVE